jgi:hypothetical protein
VARRRAQLPCRPGRRPRHDRRRSAHHALALTRKVVDLLLSYSKRPDIADDLAAVLDKLDRAKRDQSAKPMSVKSEKPPTVRRVSDRLSEADIQRLIARYRQGATGRELAVEFKLGLTSVKLLLRERGVRRRGQPRRGAV